MAAEYNFGLFDENAARQIPQSEQESQNNIAELSAEDLKKSQRRRIKPLRAVAGILCVALLLGILGSIVFGQVQIMELSEDITAAQETLSELKSRETQMSFQTRSSMTTAQAGKYAEKYLGMIHVAANQQYYVGEGARDGGEIVQAVKEPDFFEKIFRAVNEIFA